MRTHVQESDRCKGKPLYEALAEEVLDAGLAGATVLCGVQGYGAGKRLHKINPLQESNTPMVIEMDDKSCENFAQDFQSAFRSE